MSRRKSFVATPVAHLVGPGKLRVINGRLAFVTGQDDAIRLDAAALRSVCCYGDVGVTDEAFRLLFEHDVEVSWLTPAGTRCRGRLVRSDAPHTALRVLQHVAFLDPAVRTELARRVVAEKIHSQVHAARHYQRQGCTEAGPLLARLRTLEDQCGAAPSSEVLRGVEGAASAAWFELLGTLLRPPWQFTQRRRRPPPDPVNALLSLGYTWLLTRTVARVEAAGLESALGALHEYRAGRPSLACDLMEPLRVPAVDRWVVALCNGSLIAPDDFREENGAVHLQSGVFGRILTGWQTHWIESEQDRALDGLVQGVVARLRAESARLPTPREEEPEGGGSGNDANDEG